MFADNVAYLWLCKLNCKLNFLFLTCFNSITFVVNKVIFMSNLFPTWENSDGLTLWKLFHSIVHRPCCTCSIKTFLLYAVQVFQGTEQPCHGQDVVWTPDVCMCFSGTLCVVWTSDVCMCFTCSGAMCVVWTPDVCMCFSGALCVVWTPDVCVCFTFSGAL